MCVTLPAVFINHIEGVVFKLLCISPGTFMLLYVSTLKLKCLTALLFYCLSCCSLCCSLFDHQILPEANQTKFHSLLQGYFQSVKKCLVGEHKELHKRQRKNQQILQVNY